MGGSFSKEEEKEGKLTVYDTSRMFYDEYGNLRHNGPMKDPDFEVEQMMMVDADNDEEHDVDTIWYIVDTPWINSWLAYAHFNQNVSPCPGPLNNNRLIVEDHENKKWVARDGLTLATEKRSGDYRRVTDTVWKVLLKLYPGSGPAITATFDPEDPAKLNGYYATDGWNIDKEYIAGKDKKKKKSKKKKKEEAALLETELKAKSRQESVATMEGDIDGIKLIPLNKTRKKVVDSDDEVDEDSDTEKDTNAKIREKDSDDEDEFLEDLLFGDSEIA